MIKVANNPAIVQLGATVPAAEFLPSRAIGQPLTKAARQYHLRTANYDFSLGSPELRLPLSQLQHHPPLDLAH
jgi:DNA-binding transcriptional MocR family regulator